MSDLIDREETIRSIVITGLSEDDEALKATAKAISVIQHMPTAKPPTTTWLGNFSPYRCEYCGRYVDSKTRYCPDCGRRASNYE